MFKSRKKRQQQKEAQLLKAKLNNEKSEISAEIESTSNKYKLLDDIHLTHDFRSSIILPELNKDLDPTKLSKQQLHLASLRDIPESPTHSMLSTPPLSPPLIQDGTKHYQELAAWRHEKSQHRYSNGLFGGKQRGRPKPNTRKHQHDDQQDIQEEEDTMEEEVSTTPETPIITTQSILQQLHSRQEQDDDEDDYEDDHDELSDDKEEEEDEELIEELYEPNSDTEENYFFQDFSSTNNATPLNKKSTRNKRRSNKIMTNNKFDLSSFARDLHDHRLSVVQRESRIIMTEDDEMELEKLLERQRQRMSMMTLVSESTESLVPPPPMPSLDLLHQHSQSTATIYRTISPSPPPMKQEDVPILNNSSTDNSSIEDDVPQEIPITTTSHLTAVPTPKPVNSISSSINTSIHPISKIDQLKRSVSTTSIKSTSTARTTATTRPIIQRKNSAARKSISMDNLKENIIQQHSVTSAALDWISENETISLKPNSDPTSFSYKQQSPPPTPIIPTKSRSLFGSLRQVSRSKTHHHSGNGGIKGLVRNFSSSHHSKPPPLSSSKDHDPGMSRAAMAVIQHNVAKQEKKKSTVTTTSASIAEKPVLETAAPKRPPQKRRSRSKSDANLISNLISRASSSRKQSMTKIVNMEDDATAAAKKRAQVVRRTIIYVQPDSLHNLLKNGGDGSSIKVPPPMPPKLNTRNTMVSSDGSLSPDDETVRSREYVTATKIVRQTSVRKRIVEEESNMTSSPLSETSTLLERQGSNNKKRYQLKSVDEHDLLDSKHSSSSSSNNSDYMEGVELREMSDGSVVWGLVKKQGNRKSFYTPNQQGYEHVDDEEDDGYRNMNKPSLPVQQGNNNSPPPIPKRSPRRQASQTDVYYSNQVSLPNLIKMMQGQQDNIDHYPGDDDEDEEDYDDEDLNERAMSSVDDQLDEMMRILTSQQQQQLQQQH